jgi:peptide/nickel transport system ATP-binding protein
VAGSGTAHLRPPDDVLLRVEDVVVEFPAGRGRIVHAVSGVSIDVRRGETLGIVGESGCGKSTLGRAILQVPSPTSGRVILEGTDLCRLDGDVLRNVRPRVQMIFQDPISSINPRREIQDVVAEPLQVWRRGMSREATTTRVEAVLSEVGLDPAQTIGKRRHQFSGGQCQRICIARALVLEPEVLVCDEPVSSLDVSVQAQILNTLEDMKRAHGLTMIFISHDLAVVNNVADRVAVMYLGKLCEVADSTALFRRPAHPYTHLLLSSVPERTTVGDLDGSDRAEGELPSPLDPPSGCRFRTRCPLADEICAVQEPIMREVAPAHFVACHHPLVKPVAAPSAVQPCGGNIE